MWFRKKNQEENTEVKLLGVSLSKYNYLGYTQFAFTNTKLTWECHFFISKNENKRLIRITGNNGTDQYEHHSYYNTHCLLWKAGERDWYQLVTDYHSNYLKNRMLEEFGVVWCEETKWWVSSDQAKYDLAQAKQKEKTNNEVVVGETDNIVKINFTKDKI